MSVIKQSIRDVGARVVWSIAFWWTLAVSAQAASSTWNGGDGDWFVNENWLGGTPGAGATAVIDSGTVVLTNSTAALTSFVMNGGKLICSNWSTRLIADDIALNGGNLALAGAFTNGGASNRIWVVCSNMVVATGLRIVADAAGYAGGNTRSNGNGPGGGRALPDNRHGSGGGYGGEGGASSTSFGGSTYGSVRWPLEPGSGGSGGEFGRGGNGGGAVLIEARGTLTLNGTISANGENGLSGGGSGGAVLLACRALAGTAGLVRVNGGNYNSAGGGGAGGRIAVVCSNSVQTFLPTPGIRYEAGPGSAYSAKPRPDLGSVYVSSTALLDPSPVNVHGQLYSSPVWTPHQLIVSNTWVRFANDTEAVTVTNDVIVTGASGRLELGGNDSWHHFPAPSALQDAVRFSTNGGPVLIIGGDLILTNSGDMQVFAGLSNAATANVGGLIDVAGNLVVGVGSWVWPHSHPTQGGSVHFQAKNVTIASGGGFDADEHGYSGANTSLAGSYKAFGPGAGTGAFRNRGTGGGYGGFGGTSLNNANGGDTYGSANSPIDPGSGGGQRDIDRGGFGGGLVWLSAQNEITVDGTITANGQKAMTHGGGGSGGGVYLYAKQVSGSGVIRADGGAAGTTGSGGGGGGGRIAFWSRASENLFSGSVSVAFGAGYIMDATIGTVSTNVIPVVITGTLIWLR